jgi:hypothetical protein
MRLIPSAVVLLVLVSTAPAQQPPAEPQQPGGRSPGRSSCRNAFSRASLADMATLLFR